MQSKEFDYRGKTIVYRTAGSGPVVMLLHGFGEDGTIWEDQFVLFPGYQLLVPDLPGSGRSETIEDMSMEGLADAVKALLDSTAGDTTQVALIGHSMGGYITLAFAEKYPEWLRGFGLFHSTAFADSDEKKETRRKGIRFIRQHGAAEFLKMSTPNLYAEETRKTHPEWIEKQVRDTCNFSGDSLVLYYEAMIRRPDRTAVLKESRVPVLFVMGRHDPAVPLQDGLKQCYLPQKTYIHILEHAGHMGMIEELNQTNQILSQFVNATQKTA
ncbi:alpha/beta fold hydrolase [Flavisolibacter nicotianae]|uniref:alpha/beta fold hydrolase n=1 Tax=Flavisolibacter nicotianae TaxID=2364882 RepID=UPI000EB2588F|nr:alpha/beta hydrolase [Flavisolibacter nicotianae]